jgi:hypothetical protein
MDGACDLELLLYTLAVQHNARAHATCPEEHVRLIEDMNGPMVACEECRVTSKKLEFVIP